MLLKLRDRFCRECGRENYTHTGFAEWLVHDELEFAIKLLVEYLGELAAKPSVEEIHAKPPSRDVERITCPSCGSEFSVGLWPYHMRSLQKIDGEWYCSRNEPAWGEPTVQPHVDSESLHRGTPEQEATTKLYVTASAAVQRLTEGRIAVYVIARVSRAMSDDEAIGKAYQHVRSRYPTREGYEGHAVSILEGLHWSDVVDFLDMPPKDLHEETVR